MVLFPLPESPIKTVSDLTVSILTSLIGPKFLISIDSLIALFIRNTLYDQEKKYFNFIMILFQTSYYSLHIFFFQFVVHWQADYLFGYLCGDRKIFSGGRLQASVCRKV